MRPNTSAIALFCLIFVQACCVAQVPANPANWQRARGDTRIGSGDLLPPSGPDRLIRLTSGESMAGPHTLPNTEGQVWKEYDIRRYTERHAAEDKPEQTIVDWILRETGTEMWFSEPLGLLSANRQKLSVYHTREIQQIVGALVDRFLRVETEAYVFGVRLVTVSNPNWRAKALPKLKPASVQTPGVEAWLLSHEDAAVVLADLRRRTDFREHNSPNLLIQNGDTHIINRTRPVAYLRGVRPFTNGFGGHQMDMGQVEEGFSLKLSPLMTTDARHVDAVIKIDSNQIERLKNISVSAPTPQNPRQMAQVQVPQTSSWRLHERFHWPADEVLVISCGVVSSPGPERQPGVNLPNLLPRPPRSDALLFVDAKGRASELTASPQRQAQGSDFNYRGRY